MGEKRFVIFLLNDKKFCVELARVREIENDFRLLDFKTDLKYVKGMMSLRDEMVPVLNLKSIFAMNNSNKANAQYLIANTHNLKLALEVDNVLGIVDVPEQDIKKTIDALTASDTGYLDGVIKTKIPSSNRSEIVLCISIDRIVSEEDFETISLVLDDLTNKENDMENDTEN